MNKKVTSFTDSDLNGQARKLPTSSVSQWRADCFKDSVIINQGFGTVRNPNDGCGYRNHAVPKERSAPKPRPESGLTNAPEARRAGMQTPRAPAGPAAPAPAQSRFQNCPSATSFPYTGPGPGGGRHTSRTLCGPRRRRASPPPPERLTLCLARASFVPSFAREDGQTPSTRQTSHAHSPAFSSATVAIFQPPSGARLGCAHAQLRPLCGMVSSQ